MTIPQSQLCDWLMWLKSLSSKAAVAGLMFLANEHSVWVMWATRHAGSGCQCERAARLIMSHQSISQKKICGMKLNELNLLLLGSVCPFDSVSYSFFCLFCKAESWDFLKEASCGGQQVEARLHPQTQGSKWESDCERELLHLSLTYTNTFMN